jgi:zeta-carotene desaturase
VKPVVIVGAGLSGLASGVLLSRRKIPVLLLEQRALPGGRTSSFRDPATGDTLDNGQHTLIAGCEASHRLLETLGTGHLLRIQPRPRLRFHHPARGFCTLDLPPLPPPLNLAAGILRSDLFALPDKVRLLRAGSSLLAWSARKESSLAPLTVREWLDRSEQSDESRRSFWDPLTFSIMNESAERASALVFLRALRTAFLGHWRSAAFSVPRVGLSELFVRPAVETIRRSGGDLRCGARVEEVLVSGGVTSGVRLRGSGDLEAEAVVLAVPHNIARRLLPAPLRASGVLAGFDEIPFSPIVSIYLWYRDDFMGGEEILGMIGTRIQWLFNRRLLTGGGSSESARLRGFVCAVMSAAAWHEDMTNDALVQRAVDDLRSIYGEPAASPERVLVLRERRATFSLTPECEGRRPGPETGVPGLFLAGDWTATRLPATIEGAVLSAERCVERILAGETGGGARA